MRLNEDTVVAVVGLGYVGLPLALAFGARFTTIGFDLKKDSVDSFKKGVDPNGEAGPEDFAAATRITFTTDARDIGSADFVVVAVPTPIDQARQPDLSPLLGASFPYRVKYISPAMPTGIT